MSTKISFFCLAPDEAMYGGSRRGSGGGGGREGDDDNGC